MAVVLALGLAGLGLSTAGAQSSSNANVGWGGFGNTPDENRYSPLTQIDPGNVSSLGRLFTVDFTALDPTVRHGEQSYPVEANGTLYVTTNNDNVWALSATTGQVEMALVAGRCRRLQRLRAGRQPRRRPLRRPRVRADAQHGRRLA